MPCDVHGACEEARIEQVQNRVLDPADVLIDVHPVACIVHIGGRRGVRCCEPCEIPAGIDKRVHRVGFALGGFAAFGAGRGEPGLVPVKRVAGFFKGHIVWQFDGQVFFLFAHNAAVIAMNNRDRAAPIALTGKAPIAQAELGDALA